MASLGLRGGHLWHWIEVVMRGGAEFCLRRYGSVSTPLLFVGRRGHQLAAVAHASLMAGVMMLEMTNQRPIRGSS